MPSLRSPYCKLPWHTRSSRYLSPPFGYYLTFSKQLLTFLALRFTLFSPKGKKTSILGPSERCIVLANSVLHSDPVWRITNPHVAPSTRVCSPQQIPQGGTERLNVTTLNQPAACNFQGCIYHAQTPHAALIAKRRRVSSTESNWTLEEAHNPSLHENRSEILVLIKTIGLFQLVLLNWSWRSTLETSHWKHTTVNFLSSITY